MKKLEPLEADHTKLKANVVGCEMVSDATHGSLALKAYQQNLYLKYYY